MKKIKLMALGLMVMMIQSVGAVTLPSTSYSPSTSYDGNSEVVFSGGSMVTGSYVALGTGYAGECTGSQPSVPPTGGTCSNCCDTKYNIEDCMGGDYSKFSECAALNQTCMDACMSGPTLPLDGGLSILLVLALGSGAVRMFRKKQN